MFAQVSTIALEAVKACVNVVRTQEGRAVAKMDAGGYSRSVGREARQGGATARPGNT